MLADFSIAHSAPYPALQALAGSSAVSPEADELRRAAKQVVIAAESSQALFVGKAALLSELAALEIECADEDWDGNGAAAIDFVAVLQAECFVRALPDRCPLPEVAVEPDGSISLDWIQSRDQLFSVSVGRSSRLAFAWVDGTDSGYGVESFDGRNVPQRILQGIEAAIGTDYAAVRAT